MCCSSEQFFQITGPDVDEQATTGWTKTQGAWHRASQANQTIIRRRNCPQTTRMQTSQQVKFERCNNPLKEHNRVEGYPTKDRVCFVCSRHGHSVKCCAKRIRRQNTVQEVPAKMRETPRRTLIRRMINQQTPTNPRRKSTKSELNRGYRSR